MREKLGWRTLALVAHTHMQQNKFHKRPQDGRRQSKKKNRYTVRMMWRKKENVEHYET